MARKKRQDNSPDIETVAVGAAIVGLSAAILSGNMSSVSSGLGKITNAASNTITKLSAEGIGNVNFRSVKRVYGEFKDDFAKHSTKTFNRLRPDGFGGVFSTAKSIPGIAQKAIDGDILGIGANYLTKQFASVGDDLDNKRIIAINNTLRRAYDDLKGNITNSGLNTFKKDAKRALSDNGLFSEKEAGEIMSEAIQIATALGNKGTTTYKGKIDAVSDAIANTHKLQNKVEKELDEKIFNIASLEKKFGSALDKNKKGEDFFGKRLTLEEAIAEYKKLGDKNDFMDAIVEMAESRWFVGKDADRYKNLYFDKNIRKDKDGNIFTMSPLEDMMKKINDAYNETVVAKVAKTDEFIKKPKGPFDVSYRGAFNPVINKAATGSDSLITDRTYIQLYDEMYSFKNGELTREKSLDGIFEAVDNKSVIREHVQKMYGATPETLDSRTGLDFNRSYKMNPIENASAFISKFKDKRYGRNMANFVFDDNSEIISFSSSIAENSEIYDNYAGIAKILKTSDRRISQGSALRISQALSSKDTETSGMFKLLSMSDSDMVDTLLEASSRDSSSAYAYLFDESRVVSDDLISNLRKFASNPSSYLKNKHIVKDAIDITGDSTSYTAEEYLRRLINDEAMLKLGNNKDISDVSKFINTVLSGNEAKKATRSYYASQYINLFDQFDTPKSNSASESMNYASYVLNTFINGGKDSEEKKRILHETIDDTISLLQKGFNDKQYYSGVDADTVFMKKAVSAKDTIRSINAETLAQGTSGIKDFFAQFIAGANSTQNVTSATFGPYFFVNRLMNGLDSIGLGFSSEAYSSTGNLAKNIMLKRVAPIAGGLIGLSYLNYEMENFTGMSGSEAFLSGIANVDLGVRRITDTLGLSSGLRNSSIANPLISYWSNEEEYQGYNERKEWYESGYSPVRQGRYWSFGSASEFRGGKITYFEPSYLRQATSNYRDVSLYGSSEEKWKHSIIPTPRHPFSTLRYLSNPYWLEEKHYEDRPYPMTGKMFDETTPWGVILNPTVGALIKPQRRMHQMELQGTTVDVRALIRKRNEQEKEKAQSSYIGIGNTTVSNVIPTGGGGSIQPDYNVYYNGSDTAYAGPVSYGGGESSSGGGVGVPVGGPVDDISIADSLKIASATNPFAFVATNFTPIDEISKLNAATKNKGFAVRGGYNPNNFTVANAPIYSDSIQYDPTRKQFDESDYMDNRSTEEWLRDVAYSAKELSGIYGFALDMIAPPSVKYTDAHAGAMTSFSGRFWDESVGGVGGDFMEIARRFFPHEDHSVKKINNIQNNMPEWIPERYRYGDPYTALPKGDMRFPGAGYETLNELHADEYGSYGSFDRFKILADIAPWSAEYKQWRQIAKQNVKDPELVKEMQEIERRVEKQSSRHTFYNKNYSIKTEDISGTVAYVGKDTFTLYGSDKQYSLAGIDLGENQLSDFLSAGSDISITIEKDSNDEITPAIVYDGGVDSLTRRLSDMDIGTTVRDTPIDVQAYSNGFDIFNAMAETVAHAPIPFIHNKFMRINTPMEAWEEEELYGTSYSTWNHPIEGFIKPAIRKTMAMDNPQMVANIALFGLSKYLDINGIPKAVTDVLGDTLSADKEKIIKTVVKGAQALTNPASFAGGMTASIATLGTKYASIGADIGEAIGLGALLYEKSDNPIIATAGGALIGATYGAKFFEKSSKEGMIVGAIVGLGVSALRNSGFDANNWKDVYIPESAEERWDMQEYFDRLKYIKYMGLYEKAAAEAKSKEGVDIEKIINKVEYNKEENDKLAEKLIKQQQKLYDNDLLSSEDKSRLSYSIQSKLNEIYNSENNIVIEGGEYTKAAIAYKQAAESTIYGLTEDASMSQILRALPKNHRDFFIEFQKEDDKKKREEIRSKVSDYEQKVLDILWNEKPRKQESNAEFFDSHYLPGTFWAGWNPGVSLDNIQINTIKNEGMMLSDFGFYESNENDYDVLMSPTITNYDVANSPAVTRKNLITSMNGLGLFGVDVSLTPTPKPGIEMISEIFRVSDYEIKNSINKAMGGRILY